MSASSRVCFFHRVLRFDIIDVHKRDAMVTVFFGLSVGLFKCFLFSPLPFFISLFMQWWYVWIMWFWLVWLKI